MAWYVINEYETFAYPEPKHAWTLLAIYANKKDAELQALEINYDLYCKNYRERWPTELKNLIVVNKEDKLKIVLYVIKNINNKTGSANNWLGTGCWITSTIKLSEKELVPRSIPNITELFPQPVDDGDDSSSESSLDNDDP